MILRRRTLLLGLASTASFDNVKFALADQPGQKRFVVILLRGALDGMAAVVPYGDPHLAALRAPLVPAAPGQPGGMYDLGGFYGLNPSLPNIYAMYQAGQALPIHAVAGPYRTRSHFEAQDLLQLGTEQETGITSGWLNRVLSELPARNDSNLMGISAGLSTPLLLQGPRHVDSYTPTGFSLPSPDLFARIEALNASDPLIGPPLDEGVRASAFDHSVFEQDKMAHPNAMGATSSSTTPPISSPDMKSAAKLNLGAFPMLATKVGELLATPNGPRVAAFQIEGWDTHADQVASLEMPLSGLDQGMQNLKTALGPAWHDTVVLIVTEFGRTAAMNGTNGSDHGTATAAFVLGGNVAGGRVLATWPGLAPNQLFQNRDLAPTRDIRSVAKGLLAEHLRLDQGALSRIFPGSSAVSPTQNLIRNI